jgi:hypothetical protein
MLRLLAIERCSDSTGPPAQTSRRRDGPPTRAYAHKMNTPYQRTSPCPEKKCEQEQFVTEWQGLTKRARFHASSALSKQALAWPARPTGLFVSPAAAKAVQEIEPEAAAHRQKL